MLNAKIDRRACATLRLAKRDDQRRVGINHVALRALSVSATGKFNERIALWNTAILREPTCRTPAAAFRASRKRRVQRTAVDASLAARDDLQDAEPFACSLTVTRLIIVARIVSYRPSSWKTKTRLTIGATWT